MAFPICPLGDNRVPFREGLASSAQGPCGGPVRDSARGAHPLPPIPAGRTPTALPRWPQFPAGLPLGASPAVPRTQRLGEAGRARKPAAGGERRGSPRPQAVLSLRFLDPRSPRCASLLGWLAPPEWQTERSVFNVFVMGLEMNSGWLVPSGALGSGRGAPPPGRGQAQPCCWGPGGEEGV